MPKLLQQSAARRLKAGDLVSFLRAGRRVTGQVIEDRGPLGVGGRRLYRILAPVPPEGPEESSSFEMPEEEMTIEDPLRVARRTLFRETANRVVQRWWLMPAEGLIDHLQGYQGLSRAVTEACREVAERVRSEAVDLAKGLGLDADALARARSSMLTNAQEYAARLGQYAAEHGLDGLHLQVENALWDAAVAERDRLLSVAREHGWSEFERRLSDPAALRDQYPLLILLAA